MTAGGALEPVLLAISLFNASLQLWLGFTVLLSADRRGWGIWLAGGALVTGGAFFLAHGAMVGLGVGEISQGIDVWWWLTWMPGIGLPLSWYLVMLWHARFWEDRASPLHT